MTPTGWFQVAWSHEVEVGQVHRMRYFDRELVAWRGQSGQVTVMDAYCEHLGAHLGYGGTVTQYDGADTIQCPFHGWQWNTAGRNACIPYEDRPNIGKKIRTFPTAEANEAIYIWHDVEKREPYFDVPDIFTAWGEPKSAADYHPARPGNVLLDRGQELHPQYVLENGVDVEHFRYVHETPINPVFTRHDFDQPVSYVDFTITFDGDEQQTIDDVTSGVQAINGGLGIAVTKSWGMIDNRTISCITPVDDRTSDVRFMTYIGKPKRPPRDPEKARVKAEQFGNEVIRQFRQDIHIWSHQRYSDPPALATSEMRGFTAIREWARQFYPDGIGGSAAEVNAARQKD